ncbi:AP-4 complex accessory subunit RUSC1 [Eudromia elegans]
MLAPGKGLLCNLNHVHLQHVSLGLRLSRHPELRESPGGPAGCGACGDSGGRLDANSNSACTKCRCCEAHGLRNRAPQGPPPAGDAASPGDPPSTSSSVSSCSELSPEESPVSVCRGAAPLLPEQGDPCGGGDPGVAVPRAAAELLDSLSSSSSSSGGGSLDSCSEKPPGPPRGTDADPNCNPVPARWDHNRNVPPPVPPRPRRALPEPRGNATKTVTSFHELAQKRKRPAAAAAAPARGDRSDWLIVFSPDTELPPPGRFPPATGSPEGPRAPPRPPERGPREVTTFKELRYRSGGRARAPTALEAPQPPRPPPPSQGAVPGPPAPVEKIPPKRRKSRPGLQPLGEGGPGGAKGTPGTPEPLTLLVAVSASVDQVVAHFSAARNVVQKTQLGDSWLSPDVGYLLLHTLCPALCALVEDGLKPFQKDLITGQRRTSPWSVVEASARPGPGTRALHALCCRVARLAPLAGARQRFHAFVLGLLNTKQLELWLCHLHKSPGVVSALYLPSAFFALSQGPQPQLADELLLLLQPLSVLTFRLDLLFEHRHLHGDERPPAWPRHRGPVAAPAPDTRPRHPEGAMAAAPVGAALQQTLQHVRRWGDWLGRTLLGAEAPAAGPGGGAGGPGAWWQQQGQGAGRDRAGTELQPLPPAAPRTEPGGPVPPDAASTKAQSERRLPASLEPPAEAAPARPSPEKGSWLGRLFGATCPAARGFAPGLDSAPSRRPSSWLSPRMAVLAAVTKGAAPRKGRAPQGEPPRSPEEAPQPCRALRVPSDPPAAGPGSREGDVLQPPGPADEERICRGGAAGPGPVGCPSQVP